jgi:hypothetical protein
MAGVPLESLVTGARTAANMQVGGPWAPDEWDAAVNKAVKAFWVDCLAVNNTVRVSTTTLTITSTASPSALLPSDFMNALKVTKDPGSSARWVIPKSGDERDTGERTYRLEGSSLWIDPLELSVGTYELRYNPLPAALTPAVNLDAELAQHEEYFTLHAAIQALASEQSSIADLAPQFAICKARAEAWAGRQRSSDPQRPRDVRPRGGMWWRR